jgi:hypothetical protein
MILAFLDDHAASHAAQVCRAWRAELTIPPVTTHTGLHAKATRAQIWRNTVALHASRHGRTEAELKHELARPYARVMWAATRAGRDGIDVPVEVYDADGDGKWKSVVMWSTHFQVVDFFTRHSYLRFVEHRRREVDPHLDACMLEYLRMTMLGAKCGRYLHQ